MAEFYDAVAECYDLVVEFYDVERKVREARDSVEKVDIDRESAL